MERVQAEYAFVDPQKTEILSKKLVHSSFMFALMIIILIVDLLFFFFYVFYNKGTEDDIAG